MVSKSPKVGLFRIPVPNGLNGLYIGVTNYLLSGIILQVLSMFLEALPYSENQPLAPPTWRGDFEPCLYRRGLIFIFLGPQNN